MTDIINYNLICSLLKGQETEKISKEFGISVADVCSILNDFKKKGPDTLFA
jgi:transposase